MTHVVFEQPVAAVKFRHGRFTLTDPDQTILTNFKAGDKHITLKYKGVEQEAKNGRIVNRLIVASEDGAEFRFTVKPASTLFHDMFQESGDIVGYLRRKAKKD